MNKDILLKRFFSDNERFADIINGFGCEGIQYVHPEDLCELDSQEGVWKDASQDIQKRKGKSKSRNGRVQARDLVRKTAFGMNFAIVGLENQEAVDYSLPFRAMRYDVNRFEEQVAKIQKKTRANKKGLAAGELLYGFKKDSKLHPVITFILYYGEQPYDGALDLHGLIDFSQIPDELHNLVMNYKANVIDIGRIDNFDMLHTDVKIVFELIRHSDSKEKWEEIARNNPTLAADAYNVALAYADFLEEIPELEENGGTVDMCQAIRGFIEQGRQEGLSEGRQQGISEGRTEGEQRMATLIMKLCSDGKVDIIAQVASDEQLRNQYYREYCI